MALAPSLKHISAAVVLDAVETAAMLLDPFSCSNEQLFEAFEALIWLHTPDRSDCFFEACGWEAHYARRKLEHEHLMQYALGISITYWDELCRMYGLMGRQLATRDNRKISDQKMRRYGEQELECAIRLLWSLCPGPIAVQRPAGTSESSHFSHPSVTVQTSQGTYIARAG